MSKHTPGPWFAKGRYIGTKNHMSLVGECRDVNGDWTNEGPASANARLIAAAPELLEACIKAREWLNGWASADPYIGVLDAAIAKATGSEQ